jgi:outer membrane protein assembly factor BamB
MTTKGSAAGPLFAGALAVLALVGPLSGEGRADGEKAARILWRRVLPSSSSNPRLAASESAVFVTTRHDVSVLDPATGKLRGVFAPPAADVSAAAVVSGNLAVVSAGEVVYGLTRAGRERWRHALGGATSATSRAPIVGDDGTVYATSVSGEVVALEAATGAERWRVALGADDAGVPPAPVAVTHDLLVLWARPRTGEAHGIVALGLGAARGRHRFTARPGQGLTSLVALDDLGVVSTSYAEASSGRGGSLIVAHDPEGHERWRIARGRLEQVLAAAPGRLVGTSQDAAGAFGSSLLELWSREGRPEATVALGERVAAATCGADGRVYAVTCGEEGSTLVQLGPGLAVEARIALGRGCHTALAIDRRGRLLAVGESAQSHATEGRVAVTEVIALQTVSVAPPVTRSRSQRSSALASGPGRSR